MAMNFNYRFSTILKVKELLEEKKKNHLAKELRQMKIEKDKLNVLLNKKESNLLKWDEITKDNKVTSIKELQNSAMHIENINRLVDVQTFSVQNQKIKLDETRQKLVEAKKQTKIFEKIKEKDYEEFLDEQAKQEALVVDQLVTYKSTVKKGG